MEGRRSLNEKLLIDEIAKDPSTKPPINICCLEWLFTHGTTISSYPFLVRCCQTSTSKITYLPGSLSCFHQQWGRWWCWSFLMVSVCMYIYIYFFLQQHIPTVTGIGFHSNIIFNYIVYYITWSITCICNCLHFYIQTCAWANGCDIMCVTLYAFAC